MFNHNSDTDTQSILDVLGDTDRDKGARSLSWLRSRDIFATYVGLGGDTSHSDDPKGAGDLYEAKKIAKGHIINASDKAFAFWQVFEAVYSGSSKGRPKLEQDAWTTTLYSRGKSTTKGKLVAELERVLEMSRPKAPLGFYDGQLDLLLENRQFQPVKRYLDQVYKDFTSDIPVESSGMTYYDKKVDLLPEWDNLGEVLFGTKDSLTQEMISCWLVGAVKRVLEPGCYMKRALILKGDQDAGKSAFVKKLAKFWGTELPSGTSDMDMIRLITRTWIMELAECDKHFKGKEASVLKQQISTTVDKYIPKYKEAGEMVESPRSTVFIGTTNKDQFLVDETGNNRFWVIDTANGWKLPLAWLDANVDQLWATAYHKLTLGHPTDISPDSLAASEVRNRDYMVEGSWVEQLETVLAKATCEGKRLISFQLVDLMSAMGIRYENQGKSKAAILVSLKQLGYEQKPFSLLGKTTKLYYILTADKPTPAKFDPERMTWTYLNPNRKEYI